MKPEQATTSFILFKGTD